MSEHLNEEEIKIEYNESFETDPLCEKIGTNSITNYDVLVDNSTLDTQDREKDQAGYNNSPIFSSHSSICDLELEDFDCNSLETQATWYKEIDDSGKYVCKFCDLTYSTIQTVRHHVKTKHPENANALKNIIKNNKRNRKIKCHICKQRFKLIASLKEHVKEHSENLLRSCQVCLATFNNNREMTQHLYHKHPNTPQTKTYSCLTCGYRTRKLSHYRQHKNTHLQNKELKCDFCDYSTNYSPNLKIHVRIHTNYKPYACDYGDCGYRCAAKSALRSHQLKHYPEQNILYCDRCTYKTVYRQSLKVHIESHDRNSLRVTI
ncbi:uncharacterized protein isoform X1 [Choristoneura fumiferana]|uniref:uncharacterized protein isoform X1 n=1 Tax=Choristoneura fumiferana TaxID=7141 RepID=UPI003D15B563